MRFCPAFSRGWQNVAPGKAAVEQGIEGMLDDVLVGI
jgi:hypothetical protein